MPFRISGFSKLSSTERRELIKKYAKLSDEEIKILDSSGGLGLKSADRMIENVIGVMSIPIGMATGFVINSKEYLVPMATEQRNVIAMATRGAELTRATGGFKAECKSSTMIGQIQLLKVRDFEKAKQMILANKEEILFEANTQSKTRKALDVEVRTVETTIGPMLIVELLVDVKDSMGANVVDSMCEAAAPLIASLTEGKVSLRVVSNLATRRFVHVESTIGKESVGGKEVVDSIVEAYSFAAADPYRATTHNKGIMNGVSSVLLATSNDTRAVEAAAHAYAALTGCYLPLSNWKKDDEDNLVGKLLMPMPVGIIGGSISIHPMARIALKILGVKTAMELGEVAAAAGLACNLAALEALVTSGITSL